MKLLKFSADWCHPCKIQSQDFEKNPLSVPIQEIDIEDNDELVPRYKVSALPTLVLLQNETTVLKTWVGTTKATDIQAFIESVN